MATNTPNLGLTKPATTEAYSVPVQNANMDKIDAAVDGLNKSVVASSGAIAYESGFSASTAGFIRKWGRVVEVSLAISGSFDTTPKTVGTLSAGFTPIGNVFAPVVNGAGSILGRVTINSSGTVSITMSGASSGVFFNLCFVASQY